MHLIVEMQDNKTAFYKIDGRYINKFISKVKKDLPEFKEISTYSRLKDNIFEDCKTLITNSK